MATSKPPKSIGKGDCPHCGKATIPKYRPFCSERCSQLDLASWFNEDYRMPVVETDDFDEDDYSDE